MARSLSYEVLSCNHKYALQHIVAMSLLPPPHLGTQQQISDYIRGSDGENHVPASQVKSLRPLTRQMRQNQHHSIHLAHACKRITIRDCSKMSPLLPPLYHDERWSFAPNLPIRCSKHKCMLSMVVFLVAHAYTPCVMRLRMRIMPFLKLEG